MPYCSTWHTQHFLSAAQQWQTQHDNNGGTWMTPGCSRPQLLVQYSVQYSEQLHQHWQGAVNMLIWDILAMADVLTIAWYSLPPDVSLGLYAWCVIWVIWLMCHLGCMSDVSLGLYVWCVIWVIWLMCHLGWVWHHLQAWVFRLAKEHVRRLQAVGNQLHQDPCWAAQVWRGDGECMLPWVCGHWHDVPQRCQDTWRRSRHTSLAGVDAAWRAKWQTLCWAQANTLLMHHWRCQCWRHGRVCWRLQAQHVVLPFFWQSFNKHWQLHQKEHIVSRQTLYTNWWLAACSCMSSKQARWCMCLRLS